MPPDSGTPSGASSQDHPELILLPQSPGDLPSAGWHSSGVPQAYDDDDATDVQVKVSTIFSTSGKDLKAKGLLVSSVKHNGRTAIW